MRGSIIFILIFASVNGFSQENTESNLRKLKADASVSINSNGIASIPAFSLGDPAVIASIALAKNRFSYDPVLAYGLDMKPWFIDNWLHYKLIRRKDFEIRAGFNFSTFFSKTKLPDMTILQGDRYFALEVAGIYRFTPNTSLTLMYWNDRGQEKGTIKGHFFNLLGEIYNIRLGNRLVMMTGAQLFAISYEGYNDGVFISPKISFSMREVPFSLYWQATQVIDSNIDPNPGFKWNIGLSYTL
ncbi:MAG: hypothetical protein GX431_08865 [Bacteroidales bacterium]|nr:hypothetical protein [Bacteroidales bacterium]